MKAYSIKDYPIKVCGIPFFEKTGKLERLPDELCQRVKSLEFLGKRPAGSRVLFRTNADEFSIEIKFKTLSVDIGMSLFSCQSAEVLIGPRQNYRFAGLVSPPDYNTKHIEKTFKKSSYMEDITIFLPRNEIIEDFKIIIPDSALLEEPTPYKNGTLLFYGSSITEGGIASRPSNCYNAILSNRLDFDYYNFGFSGSARGEIAIAEYINQIDISLFVMDYDHNAPSIEHLEATHEPFFKKIRENSPNLPIIIMSKPDFEASPSNAQRREIIYKTYINAVNNKDKNVYFIDGEKLFGTTDRALCTIDMTHPNDLGFYRMAEYIEPVIKNILDIR